MNRVLEDIKDRLRWQDMDGDYYRATIGRAMDTSTVKPGDIVEVDKKGRRFLAYYRRRVNGTAPVGGSVVIEPIQRNISYTRCTPNEVVGHWRASKATTNRRTQ